MSRRKNQGLGALALTLLLILTATECRQPLSPQSTFDHAEQAFLRGDLSRAEAEAQSAYERFPGHDQRWAWRFRLLDAEAVIAQGGRSDEALALLATTLPPQLTNSDVAIKRQILQASAYIPLDKLDEADHCLSAAETLDRNLGLPLSGEIARARGALQRRRNDLEGAGRFFRRSLQLANERNDLRLELTDLLNLGAIAEQVEHYDESIGWSEAANTRARALGDLQFAEAALGNQAWDYYKMGDFDKALAMYREAEKTANEIGAVYHRIQWLNNIGLVYYQLNQFPAAENYYKQSLELAEKSKNSAQIIDALTSLAFLAVQTGQLDDAQQYADRAFHLSHERNDRSSELPAVLVRGQVAAARGEQKQAEEVFHEVANDPKSDLSLRWEAQNDLAKLYEQERRLADADKQYRQALGTIEQARSSLQREDFKLPFLANAAHLYDDYIGFLLKQGTVAQALQLADYSRAQTLAEGLGILPQKSAAAPATLDAQRIAQQAKSVVLFYWLGRDRSYLWAITSRQTKLIFLPAAAEIDAAVQRYRQALLGWQDVLQTANSDGRHLFDILVGSAKDLIAKDSRVIIISDGSLDGLNFETLLTPDSPTHYWIEDVTLLNANSLRVLAASQTRQKTSAGKLLLIGDPTSSSADYASLPNARAEMDDVQKHFATQARVTYAREQATPVAYLSGDPGQFSFIHFVAHATASKMSPLDSAIVLSRSSVEEDSFKLYARDITHRPLNASLVTISSCYGAGARAYSGEGLVGLSWAFLRAGAHNVIGALWEVNDASTATLMDKLYDQLNRGRSPDAALRSAKLALLKSDGVIRKPFYWAPFQLYTGK